MSKRRLYEVRTKIAPEDGEWCGQARAIVGDNIEDIAEVWADSYAEAHEQLATEVSFWFESFEAEPQPQTEVSK